MTKHEATMIATLAHAGQERKTDGFPYLVHPLRVGQLLTQYNCREALVCAGIMHDVEEDGPAEAKGAMRDFQEDGDQEVIDLVLSVTEDKSLPWKERKEKYIENIKAMSGDSIKVMCADKIDNLESLLHCLRKNGHEYTWPKFNKPKDDQKWFFEGILKELKARLDEFQEDEVILSMYIQLGSYYTAVFLNM